MGLSPTPITPTFPQAPRVILDGRISPSPVGDHDFHPQPSQCIALAQVLNHTQWSKVKDKVLTPSRIADYNAGHRALFEAMQARDAETALDLINAHLAEARRDLLGAQST